MRAYYAWQGNKKINNWRALFSGVGLTGTMGARGNVVEGDVREATGRICAREGRC